MRKSKQLNPVLRRAEKAGWEIVETGWLTRAGVGLCHETEGWVIHDGDGPSRPFRTLSEALGVAENVG